MLRVDTAWDEVIAMIQEHTFTDRPGDCWLATSLADTLRSAKEQGRAAFHTVEIWSDGELVAANLGYTVGHIYSGFTKFFKRELSGVGMLMTSALAAWLHRRGFLLYATGQNASYKQEGVLSESYLLGTAAWLKEVRAAAELQDPPSLEGSAPVRELLLESLA